jgi:predicted dehydrogenase
MSDTRVRWGTIGTANIARAAVNPAIQASGNGELVAIASRDAARAAEFAAAHGIPRHYGGYADLLADAEIDAVYIPLPNALHREWAIRAARAGKHVLCEKPLALSETECREMITAAESAGVVLMEAFMYRFHPRTRRALELIAEGVIGELRMIHATFTFRLRRSDDIRLSRDLGGGSLMDVGCYCVNVSRTAVGREPTEVQAFASWGPSGVDVMMAGTLRFGDDLLATFECGLDTRRRERVELGGTEGHLTLGDAFLPGTMDVVIEQFGDGKTPVVHQIPGVDEYRCMIEHVGDCVLERRSPCYEAEEAALNMRVIEALYRSAHDGGRPTRV